MKCGSLYVRLAPIATKLRVAARLRDVPLADMPGGYVLPFTQLR